MKLILSSVFIFLFFFCIPVCAEDYHKEYTVNVAGIKIGKINWTIKIDDLNYLNNLKLKSEGLLSGIYKFQGEYFSEGNIKNKELQPNKYTHLWKTSKTKKSMNLVFRDDKLISLNQTPAEKEELRINVFNIKQNKDPLTSFLQIILGKTNSLVVDGRRTYTMNAVYDNKKNLTTVEISNYSNLWADHKRSKFEKIIFEKKDESFFPVKINIYFDGRVFKLEQD